MILYNKNEIPVPPEAKPDGDRVYVNKDIGGGEYKKVYIGVYAKKDQGTFYPNDKFKLYFPALWEKYYGSNELSPHILEAGIYSLVLLSSHRNRLYPILHKVFGPLNGNAILDFATYSIKDRTNAAYLFKPAMSDSVIFSKDRFDDSFLSLLFNKEITAKDILLFKTEWVKECVRNGLREVWLSVDGSNSNCQVNSDLAMKGKAKSKKNVSIVSYIWAVNAENGMPVTCFTNDGSTSDSKAFNEVAGFLKANGVTVKGVILDRGFLTHDALSSVQDEGFEYVVKLKGDTFGFENMLDLYGEKIENNRSYLIGEGGLFGITSGPQKIFRDHPDMAWIGLYYDKKNGAEREIALLDKVAKAKRNAEESIKKGEKPILSAEMQKYLKIVSINPKDSPNPVYRVVSNKEGDTDFFVKGFGGIASSVKMSAQELNSIYHIRDCSEKQFMICKSMLGNHVFRIHTTNGIETKALLMFIAAIIRADLMNSCKEKNVVFTRMMETIDKKIYLLLMPEGAYSLIDKSTEKIRSILKLYGAGPDDLEIIAGDISERERKKGVGVSQYHDLPKDIHERNIQRKNKDTHKVARNTDEKNEQPKRKPGRPKGSKGKKTLEREAKENGKIPEENAETKRKRGRPRKYPADQPKKKDGKPGRPKGSKDSRPRVRRTKRQIEADKAASETN